MQAGEVGKQHMELGTMIGLGLGLSMDAVAVTITNTLVYHPLDRRKQIAMPLFFGLFQGLMPLLGSLVGDVFSDLVEDYAGWVTCAILGVIGLKMLIDGLKHETVCKENALTYRMLFMQAIATSIDAMAVGVSIALMDDDVVVLAAGVIALTTFCCSLLALFLGKLCGRRLGNHARVLGGVILLVLAVKAVL